MGFEPPPAPQNNSAQIVVWDRRIRPKADLLQHFEMLWCGQSLQPFVHRAAFDRPKAPTNQRVVHILQQEMLLDSFKASAI